jgi:hypothetical protein
MKRAWFYHRTTGWEKGGTLLLRGEVIFSGSIPVGILESQV